MGLLNHTSINSSVTLCVPSCSYNKIILITITVLFLLLSLQAETSFASLYKMTGPG